MVKDEHIYCGNCGVLGHTYRRCTAPITSLGAIVFKLEENADKKTYSIKYLLIQRKDTLGFVEFMRGKYNLENIKYIYKIFEIMTKKERDFLETNEFDDIWNSLWMNKNIKQYRNEYDNSKKKFNKLKEGIILNNNKILDLKKLNLETPYFWNSPEWGFPKGRRNLKELDIDCAHREFREETGLTENDYYLYDNIKPLDEIFLGSNNIRYRHIYYLGKSTSDHNVFINSQNLTQVTEISNISWLTYEDAINKIRPYNIEKRDVLRRAHKNVKEIIKIL